MLIFIALIALNYHNKRYCYKASPFSSLLTQKRLRIILNFSILSASDAMASHKLSVIAGSFIRCRVLHCHVIGRHEGAKHTQSFILAWAKFLWLVIIDYDLALDVRCLEAFFIMQTRRSELLLLLWWKPCARFFACSKRSFPRFPHRKSWQRA